MRTVAVENGTPSCAHKCQRGFSLPFLRFVAAGFPSPAQNEIEEEINLVSYLGMDKETIRVLRVDGEHLRGRNAPDGSLLICDTVITAIQGDLIIMELDGELVVRTFIKASGNRIALYTDNPYQNPHYITEGMDFKPLGVVIQIIHSPRHKARLLPDRVSVVEIDLTEYLEMLKPSVFVARVDGNSMTNQNIVDNCFLLIDKSLHYEHNDIIVAWIRDGFTVKRYFLGNEQEILYPANAEYSPIVIKPGEYWEKWGVVSFVIINRKEIREQYA